MITVQEAEQIISAQLRDYGTEQVSLEDAMGRALAEDICADRDLPPSNRVTMDGIAISYAAFESGNRIFKVKATMAAGHAPVSFDSASECVELMTGAALPDSADTVIRYEDVSIENGTATVMVDAIKKGQNLHYKGADRKQGDIVVPAGRVIDAAVVSMAASVGKSTLLVARLPRVAIISTGDELVDVDATPTPYQVRHSNSYAIRAVLSKQGIQADMMHMPDDQAVIADTMQGCLQQYDVVLLSGGVSMGKFDYLPQILEQQGVRKLFHKVKQRPGKPFWFGVKDGAAIVFAFPGNPVSAFMCLHRYFLPWLRACLHTVQPAAYAVLTRDVTFNPELQYFLQVRLEVNGRGQWCATPVVGNGSGDFSSLLDAHAFMELPLEQTTFKAGEVFPIWSYR
jgi:molybdopterin molybdotransferase